MKVNQIIEKIEFRFPSPIVQEFTVNVHKNPNADEMQAAKSKSSGNELRGLLIGNAVYIWDANLALHANVLEYLEVPDNIKIHSFIITENGTIIPADYTTTEEDLYASSMIQRMMK